MKLETIKPELLQQWVSLGLKQAATGCIPDYIPLLQQVNPQAWAIKIVSVDGKSICLGDRDLSFPLMSVIKPFVLLYLLSQNGEESVFSRVGQQASSYPYNSLAQLEADGGWPRNPMINSGAIALASLLPDCESLRLWLNNYGNCQLWLDEAMLASVISLPNHTNKAIASLLATHGYIDNPEQALEIYNQVCCITVTIADVVNLGLLLVKPPSDIKFNHCRIVTEIINTCGLYEASSTIGLPIKSGISGVVLSIVPGEGVMGSYSPLLDQQGNSIAGLYIVKQIRV